MRKLTLIFAMAAFCGTFMVSCEKNLSSVQDKKVELKSIPTVDPSNSTNEFDYIGQRHNELLYDLVTSVNPNMIDPNYIYDLYYYSGAPSFSDLENILSQKNYDSEDYTGKMKTLFDNNPALFVVYADISELIEGDGNLQQKVDQIISYENSFDFSNFTSNQKVALKAMFSVARHSMVLWESKDEGGVDLLGKGSQFKVKYIGGSMRTHQIVCSDIWGTLGGALVGGPGGALFSGAWSSATTWLMS